MRKTIQRILLVAGFVLAAQSCAPAGVPTPDPNAINTAIIQTLTALAPTSGPGIPVTGEESSSPTVTLTIAPTATVITPTATQPVSPTPLSISTATAAAVTPGGVQLSVSVATNCRTGPGRQYQRVTGLQVDTVAEVVGRNAAGDYWIIRNPGRPSQTCWLWGQYATLTGDTGPLPVFTPPATPTSQVIPTLVAGFDVFYDGLESCTGTGWWVDINVENIGGLTFQSMAMTLEDRDEDTVLSLSTDGFTDRTGCSESATYNSMPAGSDRTVSSPIFNYSPNDHRLRATIRLCSNLGQGGTCVTQTVNFEP